MKKFLGFLLAFLGLIAFCAGVFFAFDGKYGINQFMSSFPSRMGSPDAFMVIGLPGVAALVIGILLIFKSKK